MIKIVAHNYLKEENVDEAMAILKELVKKSRAEEANIAYDLFVDKRDPTHIVFIEEWPDKDALKAHGASEHFTTLLGKCKPFMAKEGTMTLMNAVEID